MRTSMTRRYSGPFVEPVLIYRRRMIPWGAPRPELANIRAISGAAIARGPGADRLFVLGPADVIVDQDWRFRKSPPALKFAKTMPAWGRRHPRDCVSQWRHAFEREPRRWGRLHSAYLVARGIGIIPTRRTAIVVSRRSSGADGSGADGSGPNAHAGA
jgi:hypothetical protein